MNASNIRIYRVGDYTYDHNQNLNVKIKMSQSEEQHLDGVVHPGKGLTDTPMVFSSALQQYGSAQSIEQLNEAVQDQYKDIFWGLFTIAATFPTASRFYLDLTDTQTVRLLLETPTSNHYVWWLVGQTDIYVTENIEMPEDGPNTVNFNPGELMFAFSIVAEHIRLGSRRFAIGNIPDEERIYVSFYDHEIQEFRVNLDFPLMKEREIKTQ